MLIDIFDQDPFTLFIMGVILISVFFVIWFNIIRSASQSNKLIELEKMQIRLLKEIAEKNGAEINRIEEITTRLKDIN